MTRHLLVRADGDSRIGLGHVLRTMAVADELARTGARITYLCRTLSPWAAARLRGRGFGIEMLDPSGELDETRDADATVSVFERHGADAILLDHYGLKEEWTKRVKARLGCMLAAFDDLAADARDVDILIDASPGRTVADYSGLIPSGALCLAGPDYAPLRPEFALARAGRKRASGGPCRVAISMGGVDPTGVSLTCLDALDGRSDIALTVILSSDARMLDDTKARVSRMQTPTKLLLDRTDMADVLSETDLVIGAGGTSALERCALGLPSVLAILADNQRFNAGQLAQAGAAALLPDLSAESILKVVGPLVADAARRAEMGGKAARLCDGRGAPLVAAAILSRQSGTALRPAGKDDVELIHQWQSEPGARRFARNPQIPTLDAHTAWFAGRLERTNTDPFYIAERGGVASGFVRLDGTDRPGVDEVSILVSQAAQGQGVARHALGLLRLKHPERHITAEVHRNNAASQSLFAGAGYLRTGPSSFASPGWAEIVKGQKDEN